MIKAKHHIVIYPLFQRLTGYLLKRAFNSLTIEGEFKDSEKSVLIIANHISWWDGFWLMHLNLKLLQRKFHFMMLEEQLKKHWYFQYTGAYSVKKKSRNILESIQYTQELLKDNRNMIFMFPQGAINSMHNSQLLFEKGVQRIIDNSSSDFQVLFVANFIDYFSDAKPNLFMYIETISLTKLQGSSIEEEYNNFYKRSLNTQKLKTS